MFSDRQLDDFLISALLPATTTGQTIYLDNSNTPKANLQGVVRANTLAQALAACTSNAGDVIVVAPDHAENIIADMTISKHGVQIVGKSRGTKRPKFTFNTGTTDEITIGADDIAISGIDFVNNRAGHTTQTMLNVAGSRFALHNCRFRLASYASGFRRALVCTDNTVADLACADGDASAPVVTSATTPFTARDVGKNLHITSAGSGAGFTTGVYTIVSVSGVQATLDRACGADGASTGGAASWSTADDVRVSQCDFFYDGTTDTATEFIKIDGTVTNWTIEQCTFYGDCSVSCISQITLLAINVEVIGNQITNTGTDNVAGGIDLLTGTSGWVHNNHVTHTNATANTGIDAGSCALGLNYISDTVGQYGKVFGTEAT